ncbi:MAG: glycine cleavage system protein GcvH [Deltaproteobacteria bacterium]|nr:MAG: glycine cleavage system protein GcvH [Deltaproteobacteria bacterium]
MNIPSELKYTKEHEWARVEGNIVVVGITDYAQEELGDIVNVELPEEGDRVRRDEPFGAVESVKASAEIYAPVSGTVTEVNEPLLDGPEIINEDPYDEGWMIKIEMSDPSELEHLLDAEAYRKYVEEESK